jgi:hypothetical protein
MATVKVKADFPSAPPGEEFNIVGVGNVVNGRTVSFNLTKEQVEGLRKNPNLVVVTGSASVVGKKSKAKKQQAKKATAPSEEPPPVPPAEVTGGGES